MEALRFCLSSVTVLHVCLQNDVAALLKPISEKIQEIQTFRERNRGSTMFNHLSAVSESIPALGWIAVVSPAGTSPLRLVSFLECLGELVATSSLLHPSWKEGSFQAEHSSSFLPPLEVQGFVFWDAGSVSPILTEQNLPPVFHLTSPLLLFLFKAFSFLSYIFFLSMLGWWPSSLSPQNPVLMSRRWTTRPPFTLTGS